MATKKTASNGYRTGQVKEPEAKPAVKSPAASDRAAPPATDLRARAQELLAKTRQDIAQMPEQDVQNVVHDLQVHQIELQMQNDELRRTRQELETARDRYSDLYDFASCALLTLNPQGEVLEANLAAAGLLGLDRKQLIQQKFTRFIPAEAQDAFYLYCHQMLRSGARQTGELAIKSATGARLIVRIEGGVAEDPVTHKTQFRLSLSDVTKFKAAEDVLRRYELLAGHSRDIILFLRREDGRILEANAAAAEAYGYSREELLALTLHDLRAAETHGLLAAQMAQADAGGILFETIHRRKDGSTFPVEVSSRGAAIGETRTLISVIRDITERKKVEQALQQTTDELERSNLDLQQFAYVASHDLQDPFRAVNGYVGMFQRHFPDKLDAKALEYIAGAVDGVNRMEQLISGLLALSRIGTQSNALVAADLSLLLNYSLQNLQTSIKTAHATVTSDPLPTLPVRESQMIQLFQNLISNALKFRSERPTKIHVGVQKQEGRWVFSVRDNGIGIAPQYFGRIFQIFQRLHTRNQYPGTGIGLAICKKIVERHGGAMWVESQSGQGSTFYFSIPEILAGNTKTV